jgi:hypothetical protein
MKNIILSTFVVGLTVSASAFAQSSADPKPADSVAKEAISGVTYQPTAPTAPVVAPATSSIMTAPDAAVTPTPETPAVSTELTPGTAPAASATAMPAFKVTEQTQRIQRDVDHAAKVQSWLATTKPAVKTIQVSQNAVLGILAAPKEGSMQKAEVPALDLEW